MNIGLELFRAQNRLMSVMQTQKAAEMAEQKFLTPRRHPLKRWEVEAENTGTRIKLKDGISVIRWGNALTGNLPVLMMHGWEARATQMAAFVEPLLAKGFEIIAIDAPAHGMSLGKYAHPMKFVEALFAAEQVFGPFKAIVGHSMGGGSAIYAVSEGLETEKLISISGPASFQRASSRFASFIGLSQQAEQRFLKRVEQSVGLSFEDIDLVKKADKINIPTLLIHDEQDQEIPCSDARELNIAMPGSRLYRTQKLGHRKIMRDPIVVNATTLFIEHGAAKFLQEAI
jgi:pimeloyl-ACP methyl ester carboxylesterase